MKLLSPYRLLIAAGAACALLLPTAAVHADESPSAAASAVPISAESPAFTVGITDDVDSLNPFTGIVSTSYEMYQLMYPTLTDYAADDFAAAPGLAESWQESADKTTWTYKIRSGLTWSDGQPLTARDAAYSFNRILDGEYEQTNFGNYVANITKAEATDDTTLVLTVAKPSPIMEALAVYILPEHIWKEIDGDEVRSYENEPTDGQPVVGAGPYVLFEREKGQFLRFRANPDYYDGAPAVGELTFRVYKTADAVAQALRKGEIDFANELEANVFDAIKADEGITAVNAAYYGFNQIGMNVGAALADGTPIGDGNPALKDKRVRQAINHAIDRPTLVEKVAKYGTPGSTIIPPLYEALHLQPATPFDFDPARAGELLDEAGYPLGADGKRVGPDGEPFTLRLLGRQESLTSTQTVQFVQGWLEELGITIDTTIVTEDTLIELNGEGRFDLFEWGWVVEPDPDYQLSTFTCAQRSSEEDGTIYAGLSDSHFCNEEYDDLYAQQALETDPAKRAEIVRAMQQIVYDEAPYAVTFYYDLLQAYRSDRFTNFVQQPKDAGPLLFQFGTWSYQSMTPAGVDDEQAAESSTSTGVSPALIAGLGALVVAGIAAIVLVSRRRSTDEDTE
ncbi:MAG: ABC transporter substrate-binding protein [Candidatus Nanopelagicales bacterium]|jgi:peptide/nickel transport system substrate-binding protein|nr:ABC transporter substrate-binding protein [Candidatus Nanopelagicales bacterium]